MDQDLSVLSPQEITILKDAHAYITILIAGADGKIDPKELSWAEKIAGIRTFAGDERLRHFHEAVNTEISEKIKSLMASLPTETGPRQAEIATQLKELNPILRQLDPSIGAYLYKGYKSFAERIAKASGGILAFFSIGPEERKWMDLPMLDPIVFVEADEEE